MKNTLAFLAAVVITVAAVGWYLDWFKISSSPSLLGGHQNVNIDINKGKITDDINKSKEKVSEKAEEAIDSKTREEAPKVIEGVEKTVTTPPTNRN